VEEIAAAVRSRVTPLLEQATRRAPLEAGPSATADRAPTEPAPAAPAEPASSDQAPVEPREERSQP
ncbi:MAG TPA: hypothetical protein VFR87_17735, partial [Nocardioidaceae bacterium]|nr:hypothetical protein [Nocardioidaceae bacterium]